jgi:hypothetical protein
MIFREIASEESCPQKGNGVLEEILVSEASLVPCPIELEQAFALFGKIQIQKGSPIRWPAF